MAVRGGDLIIKISVARHESGCGHSMRVWFSVTCNFADGRTPYVIKNWSSKTLGEQLEKFGATEKQITGCAWIGGSLLRDKDTLEITPTETTESNWRKRAVWDMAFASHMNK